MLVRCVLRVFVGVCLGSGSAMYLFTYIAVVDFININLFYFIILSKRERQRWCCLLELVFFCP